MLQKGSIPGLIKSDPETSRGRYANSIAGQVQDREIVIDFLSIRNGENDEAGKPIANLVSRIYLNKLTAQELSQMLQGALLEWERSREQQLVRGLQDQPKTQQENEGEK